MSIDNLDKKYLKEVDYILNNEEFLKTKNLLHHGQNRYDHSVRVSYLSYKVSKFLGLNYKSAARGGLLHDFFLETSDIPKEKSKLLKTHPKIALKKSSSLFDLSDLEKDIIETHMFPVTLKVPRYAESWIVDIVDDIVSVYEKCHSLSREFVAASNFIAILLIGYLKY